METTEKIALLETAIREIHAHLVQLYEADHTGSRAFRSLIQSLESCQTKLIQLTSATATR